MVKVKPQPWSDRIKNYAVKAYQTTKDVLGAIDDGVAAFKTVHDIVSPTLVRQQYMSSGTRMRNDAKTNDYDSIKRRVQATHNAGKALLRYGGEH